MTDDYTRKKIAMWMLKKFKGDFVCSVDIREKILEAQERVIERLKLETNIKDCFSMLYDHVIIDELMLMDKSQEFMSGSFMDKHRSDFSMNMGKSYRN